MYMLISQMNLDKQFLQERIQLQTEEWTQKPNKVCLVLKMKYRISYLDHGTLAYN